MIPKVVKYGRTIEVGGPFGRRPVEKVWFGWEMALEDGETEPEAMETLRALANEQERIEKGEYRQRKHKAALERALSKPAHHRDLYEHELVRQHQEQDPAKDREGS